MTWVGVRWMEYELGTQAAPFIQRTPNFFTFLRQEDFLAELFSSKSVS